MVPLEKGALEGASVGMDAAAETGVAIETAGISTITVPVTIEQTLEEAASSTAAGVVD